MVLVHMSEKFGAIYARILEKSGITIDKGKYIPTGAFLSNLKDFNDYSVKDLDNSSVSYTIMVARIGLASALVEDVRLNTKHYHPRLWTYNPFSMLFTKYLEFSEYRKQLEQEKKAVLGGNEPNTQDLVNLMVRLTPMGIINEWQPVYRVMLGISSELFDELFKIKNFHRSQRETKKTPRISEVNEYVKKQFSGDRAWPSSVHKKKRYYTQRIVEGLADCLHDEESLGHLLEVTSAINRASYKPGWEQRFLSQAEHLIGIDIDQVPDEWGECSLKKEAVQAESQNLEERYRDTWHLRGTVS